MDAYKKHLKLILISLSLFKIILLLNKPSVCVTFSSKSLNEVKFGSTKKRWRCDKQIRVFVQILKNLNHTKRSYQFLKLR